MDAPQSNACVMTKGELALDPRRRRGNNTMLGNQEALTARLRDLPTAQLVDVARRCNADTDPDWRKNAITFHHTLRVLGGRLNQDGFLKLIHEFESA